MIVWIKNCFARHGRYLWVGLTVFSLGLLLHFPLHRLTPMVTQTIEKNTGYQIQATEIHFALPFGLYLEDVYVVGPPIMNTEIDVHLNSLRIYPSILSFVTYLTKKSLGVTFRAKKGPENWSGTVAYGPKVTDIQVSADNLDYSIILPLEQYNMMLANQTLDIRSKFDFDFRLEGATQEIQMGDFSKAQGYFKLASKETQMTTILTGTMTFEDTKIASTLQKGILEVSDLHLRGKDLKVDLLATLTLQKLFQNSRLDKADFTIFIDPSLDQLTSMAEMIGSMNQISMNDSTFRFRVSGPINNIANWRVTNL